MNDRQSCSSRVRSGTGDVELTPAALVTSLRSRARHVVAKRILDVFIAAAALAACSPILLGAAVAVRCSSTGPVMFCQERWGLNGRRFVMYKFRTMYTNAPPQPRSSDGALHKLRQDPRVTAVGRWLRRTSIDELPQLFNVLRGDMSLVGPRPLMPHMLEPYPRFHAIRSLVRPGITGLWQIRDREHSTNAAYMIAHDVEYVATVTVWRDVRILLATVSVVLSGRGSF
jgi:lipopolysaccharide/colanic/teichoic acid biosynthesis glycosyltransferase